MKQTNSLLVFVCCFAFFIDSVRSSPANGTESLTNVTNVDENEIIRREWVEISDSIKNGLVKASEYLLKSSSRSSGNMKMNRECSTSFLRLFLGIRQMKIWAIEMIDASGKIMDGIAQGSFASIGSYDECVGIKVPVSKKNPKKLLFRGKYCAVQMRPPLPPKPRHYLLNKRMEVFEPIAHKNEFLERMTKYAHMFYFLSLRFGLCVPSTCSEKDILYLLKSLTKSIHMNVTVPRCETLEEHVVDNYQVPVIVCFSFIGGLILVATLVDLLLVFIPKEKDSKRRGTGLRILLCFSLYSNIKKFLDTSGQTSESLKVLNGLRFFSMTWIVLGHEYFFAEYTMLRRLHVVLGYASNFAFQVIINATVVVDTFFFISGLLVVYVTLKMLRKTQRPFNVPVFILHRLWRLVPIHFCAVGFTFLLPLLGNGPLFHQVIDPVVETCKLNWWTNLLFINNLFHIGRPCLIHMWYLAADLQIYIFSLVVLIPFIKRPRLGFVICATIALVCMVATGLHTYLRDLPATMLFAHPDPEQRLDYISELYYMPYVHAPAYCIGMAMGYLLTYYPNMRLSKRVQLLGWCTAITFAMLTLYGVYEWNKSNLPSPGVAALYAATHRASWTLSVAWLTLACSTGYGGIINTIVSWKALVPLSRLSFIVYVTHPFIQILYYANFREEVYTEHYLAVFAYFGFLFGCYLAAFGISLVIESPMLALEKIIFERHGGQRKSPVQDAEEPEGRPQEAEKPHKENGAPLVFEQNGLTNNKSQNGPVLGIKYKEFAPGDKQNDNSYVCHL